MSFIVGKIIKRYLQVLPSSSSWNSDAQCFDSWHFLRFRFRLHPHLCLFSTFYLDLDTDGRTIISKMVEHVGHVRARPNPHKIRLTHTQTLRKMKECKCPVFIKFFTIIINSWKHPTKQSYIHIFIHSYIRILVVAANTSGASGSVLCSRTLWRVNCSVWGRTGTFPSPDDRSIIWATAAIALLSLHLIGSGPSCEITHAIGLCQ